MNNPSIVEHSLIGRPLSEIAEMLQCDYHLLDQPLPEHLECKLIIGHEKSAVEEAFPDEVRLVKPAKILNIFKIIPVFYDLLRAIWLLGSADSRTCIIINGGTRFGMLTCFLNSFLSARKRRIAVTYMYIPTGRLLRWLARRIILGSSLTAVWSQKELTVQSKLLDIPANKFIFMPYKALHSVSSPIKMRIDGYIFSGGNSHRDYRTLFEAVRGTGIPVIVSATKLKVSADLKVPEEVIFLSAREPAFARLMAASRFVVIPIAPGLARGTGEASVCNAMWHGRPVICADDISASEYIEDGVTGYVTPPGDVAKLRERIIELWEQPEKAAEMGCAAQKVAAANYTDELFSRRVKAMAILVAASK